MACTVAHGGANMKMILKATAVERVIVNIVNSTLLTMAAFDANIMADIARSMLDMGGAANDDDATFRSFFGAPILVVVALWNMIVAKGPLANGAAPKHLLWALIFLKCYSTTPVIRRVCGWPAEKTFRKWVWYFIDRISALADDLVKLNNRFDGWDGSTICLVSVDCLDCMINEP